MEPTTPPHEPVEPQVYDQPLKTSAMAIWSLVLSILGLLIVGLGPLIGLILGIIAIVKIKNPANRLKGMGLAIAGTVIGGVLLLATPIMLAVIVPAMSMASDNARSVMMQSHMRQVHTAMLIYDAKHGALPPAENWLQVLIAEGDLMDGSILTMAEINRSIGYNANVAGQPLAELSPDRVLLFEIEGTQPRAGGAELLPDDPFIGRGYVVSSLDGKTAIEPDPQID